MQTFRTLRRRPYPLSMLQFAYRRARGVTFAHPAGYAFHYIHQSVQTSTPANVSCQFSSRSVGARARRRGLGMKRSTH